MVLPSGYFAEVVEVSVDAQTNVTVHQSGPLEMWAARLSTPLRPRAWRGWHYGSMGHMAQEITLADGTIQQSNFITTL